MVCLGYERPFRAAVRREATLERRDVDAGVVTVRRTVVDGVVKPYGKADRSLRAVPLPARAADSLAGLEHRTPYALRHTYASLSIAAGVSLFELSRLMGISPAMLDLTYGHLPPDALDRARIALDSFMAKAAEAAEGGRG